MSNNRSLLGSQLMASATKSGSKDMNNNGIPKSSMGATSSYENLRQSFSNTGISSAGHIRTVIAPLKDSSDAPPSHIRTVIAPLKDGSSISVGGGLRSQLQKENNIYSKSLGADENSMFKMQR